MKIFIAIPLQDEWDNLPLLLENIARQTYRDYHLVVCVNQPDAWWGSEEKIKICENNLKTLLYLKTFDRFPLTVIDRSSPGSGWNNKDYGVGWARKTVMDACNGLGEPKDILVSLDGDTSFSEHYLESLIESFRLHPGAVALSVPYSHELTGEEEADRAILRYEIYMRHYAINLWRIGSPFCFTALGSAMALPLGSYRAIGGITPNKSGEDFYFLQKLRKYGRLIFWNPEKVRPAARFSDRVFFGTGPAMIKGSKGDWESYPVYAYRFFDEVKATYDLFPLLFEKNVATLLDAFLEQIFNGADIWDPLRLNNKKLETFIRACHEKLDGLRILQYVKLKENEVRQQTNPGNDTTGSKMMQGLDEKNLLKFLQLFYPDKKVLQAMEKLSFASSSIHELDEIRNYLVKIEEKYQHDHYSRTYGRR